MTITVITHKDCLLHQAGPNHPEQAARLEVILKALETAALPLQYEEAPLATLEQLQAVHDKDYLESLFKFHARTNEAAFISLDGDGDTIMNHGTLTAALRAAGAVILGVDLVLTHKTDTAFCCIRPPGHHAERAKAMGFCFLNNIAIGVAHALKTYDLKRVAIVDFDAHRGNGTEDIFFNDKKVLICSLYEESLYPNINIQNPAKNIITIPLAAGAGGRELRAELIQHAFEPLKKFKPQLIFFSAGFDGHRLDPISHLDFTERDYAWLSQQIKHIAELSCQGRMVSVLEGGYALEALGPCVLAHLQNL